MQTHRRSGCAILVLLLISTTSARARPMHVMSSSPAAEAIMHGRNAQYVVRFDGPVDHAQSRLEILRDGHMVQHLNPLLDSAADVLFASAPAPEPGHYVLHWIVESVPDQDASEGDDPVLGGAVSSRARLKNFGSYSGLRWHRPLGAKRCEG